MKQVKKRNYKKNKRKDKKKNSGFFTVLLITFVGIILISSFFAFTHDFFNIKTINITGIKYLQEDDVIKKSNIIGENIFLTSKKSIEKNLIKENLLDFKIEKKYPNTVNIEIVENTIIACIKNDDNYSYIDGLGKISNKTIENIKNIPEINGVDANLLKNNDASIFDDKNIKIIFKNINESNINIEKYDLSDINDIVLYGDDSIKYIIGNTNKLEEKMKLLKDLVEQISTDDINAYIINVSNIDKPLVKTQ
ncbi:cell division protein FtsQ/DivIB [Miniphocaeibacter halophilus]|uniref:FtsQ-type POTRA domain-containing protein n=1 Tax=Miniphocaeibacter halophilus TaxID=2931922 RepID=A0AC61MPN6_9FIRM|nr:FtsQ-type POTRA domain-containing protein [Miniphocaeibacter halophilus]QQK07512.1 FtsQ-type POTRA domain-containing protein [Miniphocaeibacter halophilus]